MVLTNVLLCRCFYAPKDCNALATMFLYVFPGPPDRENVIRGGCIVIPYFFCILNPKQIILIYGRRMIFLFFVFFCVLNPKQNSLLQKRYGRRTFFFLFYMLHLYSKKVMKNDSFVILIILIFFGTATFFSVGSVAVRN